MFSEMGSLGLHLLELAPSLKIAAVSFLSATPQAARVTSWSKTEEGQQEEARMSLKHSSNKHRLITRNIPLTWG